MSDPDSIKRYISLHKEAEALHAQFKEKKKLMAESEGLVANQLQPDETFYHDGVLVWNVIGKGTHIKTTKLITTE